MKNDYKLISEALEKIFENRTSVQIGRSSVKIGTEADLKSFNFDKQKKYWDLFNKIAASKDIKEIHLFTNEKYSYEKNIFYRGQYSDKTEKVNVPTTFVVIFGSIKNPLVIWDKSDDMNIIKNSKKTVKVTDCLQDEKVAEELFDSSIEKTKSSISGIKVKLISGKWVIKTEDEVKEIYSKLISKTVKKDVVKKLGLEYNIQSLDNICNNAGDMSFYDAQDKYKIN